MALLASMTGFSRSRREHRWGSLTLELSSVNSRYLEVSIRASKDLFSLEPLIQSTLRSRLSRGKVQVRVDLNWAQGLRSSRLDQEALKGYYRAVMELQRELGGPEPSLDRLLSLPGVTEPAELQDLAREEVQPALLQALEEAIADLQEMRRREGAALERDILETLEGYDALMDRIAQAWQEASEQAFSDFQDRVRRTVERLGYQADPARLAQELVLQADKWDIAEELTRSRSHIGQFRDLLGQSGAVGRKLDFLLQEMNREINTMGSKAASTVVRWLVVEGKTLLERIREQVQNVE